jgi:hypothetical protein
MQGIAEAGGRDVMAGRLGRAAEPAKAQPCATFFVMGVTHRSSRARLRLFSLSARQRTRGYLGDGTSLRVLAVDDRRLHFPGWQQRL